MAVTNFHYITRMSSGFKVYILEGNYHFVTHGLLDVLRSLLVSVRIFCFVKYISALCVIRS